MTLIEYANIIGENISAIYYSHRNVWQVSIKEAEIKTDGGLLSDFGIGPTINIAIQDYTHKIPKATLVFEAGNRKRRREYNVPEISS